MLFSTIFICTHVDNNILCFDSILKCGLPVYVAPSSANTTADKNISNNKNNAACHANLKKNIYILSIIYIKLTYIIYHHSITYEFMIYFITCIYLFCFYKI